MVRAWEKYNNDRKLFTRTLDTVVHSPPEKFEKIAQAEPAQGRWCNWGCAGHEYSICLQNFDQLRQVVFVKVAGTGYNLFAIPSSVGVW